MSNLKREKRPDKHGKLVTRLVLADSPIPTTSAPLPAPSVSPQKDAAVLPAKDAPRLMTKADFAVIADVLDMCGTHGSDDMYHVSPFIRGGNLEELRVFKDHGAETSFSTIVDVLNHTENLFKGGKPADYAEIISAHLRVAESGDFDYYDIGGNPEYEETLRVIHNNTDQVDAILTYLSDRGVDPEGLKEYLGNDVKPLREGTL